MRVPCLKNLKLHKSETNRKVGLISPAERYSEEAYSKQQNNYEDLKKSRKAK